MPTTCRTRRSCSGQTLIIPGASGGAMPAPKSGSSGGGGTYSGGSFRWPVSGYNYISQYFWSGHHALDIAASEGRRSWPPPPERWCWSGWRSTRAAATSSGSRRTRSCTRRTTTFRRWNVRVGQKVSAGQRIGSVGTTGKRPGPAPPLRGLARLPVGSRQRPPTRSIPATTWRAARSPRARAVSRG